MQEDKTKSQIAREYAEKNDIVVIDLPLSQVDYAWLEERCLYSFCSDDLMNNLIIEPKERDHLPYSKPEVVPYQRDMKNRAKILRKRQLTKQNRKRSCR